MDVHGLIMTNQFSGSIKIDKIEENTADPLHGKKQHPPLESLLFNSDQWTSRDQSIMEEKTLDHFHEEKHCLNNYNAH